MAQAGRICLTYLLLLALAVPWYWRFLPIAPETLVLGMPVWVAGAILVSAVVSLYTGWLLSRPWPDELPPPGRKEGPR